MSASEETLQEKLREIESLYYELHDLIVACSRCKEMCIEKLQQLDQTGHALEEVYCALEHRIHEVDRDTIKLALLALALLTIPWIVGLVYIESIFVVVPAAVLLGGVLALWYFACSSKSSPVAVQDPPAQEVLDPTQPMAPARTVEAHDYKADLPCVQRKDGAGVLSQQLSDEVLRGWRMLRDKKIAQCEAWSRQIEACDRQQEEMDRLLQRGRALL